MKAIERDLSLIIINNNSTGHRIFFDNVWVVKILNVDDRSRFPVKQKGP